MKKSTFKIIIGAFVSAVILMTISAAVVYRSDAPAATSAKKFAKHMITKITSPMLFNDKKGLGSITDELNFKDSKKVYVTNKVKRLVNSADGYYIDVPDDFDFTYNNVYISAQSDRGKIVVSREWAFPDDGSNVDEYISHYLNRFILSTDYQEANNITVTENSDNGKVKIITAVINNLETSSFDTYTYAIFTTKTQNFYRIMFKYNSGDEKFKEEVKKTIKTFKNFSPSGSLSEQTDFAPSIPSEWSAETRQLYDKLCQSKQLHWGVFAEDIYGKGINKTVPEMEHKLNYKFPVILSYLHFNTKFPLEFMQKNYDDNKLVELTYQVTTSNNEKLYDYTPFMDIYRGLKDDDIREFARDAKKFGHPFLFRLNNEANSDWTSYSGVVNMSDPDIFIDNWRRFYRIFKEEGVNNAIWIFNPNDRNYPPCNWNYFTAYYPGNDYVQMIGVTGYNNGTYYDNEKWREFDTIYDAIEESYMPMFEKFPWIITEFASSSIGGDKAKWINNMFKNIQKYPQIKIAVWFSYADFDDSKGEHKVARPYWLDETSGTINAFKNGLKNYKGNTLINH